MGEKMNWSSALKYCLILLLFVPAAMAQEVTERIIAKDPGDSSFIKAFRSTFDTLGNYYFETLLPGPGEKFGLFTNKKNYPKVYWGNGIALASYKAVISDAFFSDSTRKKLYYKNKTGTTVYGPYSGRIREVLELGRDHIAIELCIGKKSSLYIDNTLVNTADTAYQRWQCTFSSNGHVLYSYYKEGTYRLYHNHQLIDTSGSPFQDISINSHNQYTYIKHTKAGTYVVTSQAKYGPISASYGNLWDNGTYCYWGCANGECDVLANGHLYDHIREARTATEDPQTGKLSYRSDFIVNFKPAGSSGYVFTYPDSEKGYVINKNGKKSLTDFVYSSDLITDADGRFAFYGIRNDTGVNFEHTHKCINGKLQPIAVLNRKVPNRLMPLQLSPDGTSTYFFQTRDSVYLYRNDVPFETPVSVKKFANWDESLLPQNESEGIHYFQGINMGGSTYVLYNNTISKPLPLAFLAYDRFDPPQRGSIVAGNLNNNGFFLIEYLSPGKYQLVINNRIYKELSGIDYIYCDQSYLCADRLVFYGLRGRLFIEYTVHF